MSAWCNRREWLLLLLGLVVLFRIPSLFTPHYYGDEEIYFVMGRAWREGLPLYASAFDHKPPLIYVFAGLAQSVFWFRLLLLGWMLVHTWLFWHLARWVWAKRQGFVFLSSLLFVILTTAPTLEGNIAKGDVFGVARIAGIMAAKKTADLIPLCHPLSLSSVEISLEPDRSGSCVIVRAAARTTGKTGVEMEALTAVAAACLTIYDMCKAVDRLMVVGDVRLMRKSGGKSGTFERDREP